MADPPRRAREPRAGVTRESSIHGGVSWCAAAHPHVGLEAATTEATRVPGSVIVARRRRRGGGFFSRVVGDERATSGGTFRN